MISDVKEDIYTFFKNAMETLYPNAFPLETIEYPVEEGQDPIPPGYFSEKIFWKKSRDESPLKPYIVLDDIYKGKINKAFEVIRIEDKPYRRENWSMTVTFAVYSQGNEEEATLDDAEALTYITAIESLFNSQETFDAFSQSDIIIDEREISSIRDLSSFEKTNYSYRYEIDIVFKFDILTESVDYGVGEQVQVDLDIDKNSSNKIELEIIGE